MAATVVTHMMISLNSHVGGAPNRNAIYKRVATIQQLENISEIKYKSVIEQEQLPPSGAQFFQYNLNESAITISETSLAEIKKAVRIINESASIIAETSLVHKGAHTITESNTAITEGLTKQRIRSRTISEPSIGIGESIQKSVKRPKTITESATTISETSLTGHKQVSKTLTPESTTITETSLVKVLKKVRLLIETPTNITEALTHLKTASMSEEPITITESLVKAKRTVISIDEPHVFLSGVSFSFNPTSFKTYSFTTSLSTTENLVAKSIRAISESTAITENLIGTRIVPRLLAIENIPIGPEVLHKLVNHILTENVPITEALDAIRRPNRLIIEDPIDITESLSLRRLYKRVINPDSFTPDSFTVGAFESFKIPNIEAVEITEELEAFVLPSWQKVIIEDPTVITESLIAVKIPAPIYLPSSGTRRRRRPRWILQHRQMITREEKEEEPERIPILTEIDIKEVPIQITESLNAVKITSPLPIPIVPPTPRMASIPDPKPEPEPYFEPIPVLAASTLLPLDQEPESQRPYALQPEKEPEERLEPVSISVIPPKKSKAASAQLQILRELMNLSELEEMV